jgi:hypothetical protein
MLIIRIISKSNLVIFFNFIVVLFYLTDYKSQNVTQYVLMMKLFLKKIPPSNDKNVNHEIMKNHEVYSFGTAKRLCNMIVCV